MPSIERANSSTSTDAGRSCGIARMMRWPRLAGAAYLFAMAAPASATLIDFDDITVVGPPVALETFNPYHGYTWSHFNAYTYSGRPGFDHGIVSPSNAVFSGREIIDTTVTPIVATLQSAGRFDLVSADIGAGWYNNLPVKVEGLRGGSTVFSQIFLVDTVLAQSFALNFTDIDTVNFSARAISESTDPYHCGRVNCTQFTVDNIVIAELDEPPVLPCLPWADWRSACDGVVTLNCGEQRSALGSCASRNDNAVT